MIRVIQLIFIFLAASTSLAQPLYPIYDSQTRLFGYANWKGETIIKNQYCYASPFTNGFAFVYLCENGRAPSYNRFPAIINDEGKVFFQLKPSQQLPRLIVDNNRVPGLDENRNWGFWNLEGEVAIPFQYFRVWSFGEGVAAVQAQKDTAVYFIDESGKKQFSLPKGYKMSFDTKARFSEGLIAVSKNGKMGFMNKAGKIIIPCQFDQVGNFSEGKAYAAIITNSYLEQVGENRMGYINQKGEWIIELSNANANLENGCYFEGEEFSDGIAQMCIRENDGDCGNYGCLWIGENGEILREDWQ